MSFLIGWPHGLPLTSPNREGSAGLEDERQGEKSGQKELEWMLLLKQLEDWCESVCYHNLDLTIKGGYWPEEAWFLNTKTEREFLFQLKIPAFHHSCKGAYLHRRYFPHYQFQLILISAKLDWWTRLEQTWNVTEVRSLNRCFVRFYAFVHKVTQNRKLAQQIIQLLMVLSTHLVS